MKIKLAATGQGPARYEIVGETIIAFETGDGNSEISVFDSFDLSGIENGDDFLGIESESISISSQQIIRSAFRDDQGELHVELCQACPPGGGNWEESDWLDASEYEANTYYIKRIK